MRVLECVVKLEHLSIL